MTDGSGDGVKYKHSLLGQRSLEAEDKLGDSYMRKRGLMGVNRETEASVLGNGFDVKHGLVSGRSIKAGDIFGDSIKSKKTFFGLGPRNTTIDLHGMSNIMQGVMQKSASSGFGGGMPAKGTAANNALPEARPPEQPQQDYPPPFSGNQ